MPGEYQYPRDAYDDARPKVIASFRMLPRRCVYKKNSTIHRSEPQDDPNRSQNIKSPKSLDGLRDHLCFRAYPLQRFMAFSALRVTFLILIAAILTEGEAHYLFRRFDTFRWALIARGGCFLRLSEFRRVFYILSVNQIGIKSYVGVLMLGVIQLRWRG